MSKNLAWSCIGYEHIHELALMPISRECLVTWSLFILYMSLSDRVGMRDIIETDTEESGDSKGPRSLDNFLFIGNVWAGFLQYPTYDHFLVSFWGREWFDIRLRAWSWRPLFGKPSGFCIPYLSEMQGLLCP